MFLILCFICCVVLLVYEHNFVYYVLNLFVLYREKFIHFFGVIESTRSLQSCIRAQGFSMAQLKRMHCRDQASMP